MHEENEHDIVWLMGPGRRDEWGLTKDWTGNIKAKRNSSWRIYEWYRVFSTVITHALL